MNPQEVEHFERLYQSIPAPQPKISEVSDEWQQEFAEQHPEAKGKERCTCFPLFISLLLSFVHS